MRIDFSTMYLQARIADNPRWQERAQKIIARFPAADVVIVDSHWRIPALAQADPVDWIQSKRKVLVLGVKSGLGHAENGRSADFIAASLSNGCLSSCQYCYVARRKGGSNPLTLFMNVDEIVNSIWRHQQKLGPKTTPNQCDPLYWTYDIGCNADLALDALVCDHPGFVIEQFAMMPFAKATFATKTVNDDFWCRYEPRGHTRIRYSLMPQPIAKLVDIGTSQINDRIRSINRLVAHGYEVHVNFSPIIVDADETWKPQWIALWQTMNDLLSPQAKAQLACEAFFLSHSADLHALNMHWNPRGEAVLWRPDHQQAKAGKPDVLVYDSATRRAALAWFETALQQHLPYCQLRYSF